MVHNTGDTVSESVTTGASLVSSTASFDLSANGAGVHSLTLSGAATVGTGNTLANVITGNTGNDTLSDGGVGGGGDTG